MGVQGARIPGAPQHQHSPRVSAIFIPTIAQLKDMRTSLFKIKACFGLIL
jgi:hypothetical protein